ncbi:MAG: hypothetical protein GXN94_01970 [Aquificae bacterium]|nr:hypothetical protein [Aquificota bacterium]
MGKGFLKVAEDILKNVDNYSGSQKEFYIRTGISRAYYGLIWQLKERFEKNGYNFKGKNIHHFIPKVLASLGRFDLVEEFEILKAKRNDADYRTIKEFVWLKRVDKKELKSYIKDVHLFISRLGV